MKVAIEASTVCQEHHTGCARYAVNLMDALLELQSKGIGAAAYQAYYRLSRRKERRFCHRPQELGRHWYQEPVWPLFPGVDLVHGTDILVPHWRRIARVATLHDVFNFISETWSSPCDPRGCKP
jgi:hypothetical protein